jgi:signal transduction histidine kinase/CheY-like chemotaxis protein
LTQHSALSCAILGFASAVGAVAFLIFYVLDFTLGIDVAHSKLSRRVGTSLCLLFVLISILLTTGLISKEARKVIRLVFVYLVGLNPAVADLFRPLDGMGYDLIIMSSSMLAVAGTARLTHKEGATWLVIVAGSYFFVQAFFFGSLGVDQELIGMKNSKFVGQDRFQAYVQILQAAGFAYLILRAMEARERVLFKRERQIAKSAEERLHLLQSIGHDLRQPLTAINLHCDLARAAFLEQNLPKHDASLSVVQQNLEVMNMELTQITEIAEAGREAADFADQAVDLLLILNQLSLAFSERARLASINLVLDEGGLDRVAVRSNTVLVRKIFTNLLHNAFKYTEPVSRIQPNRIGLRVSMAKDAVAVSVHDTGIGIAESKLSRIWEPFFQIANPERNRDRGFGLGLAHVKAAIDRLPDHSIAVESHVDRGTTFTVCMPLADVEELDVALAKSECDASDEAMSIAGSFVMVLEDDVVLRQALVQALHQFEARAVSAHDLASARLLYSKLEVPPDVVIVDHRLPDGNGREFILEINKSCADNSEVGPQIIYLSGEHSSALNLSGLVNTTLVRKPIDFAMLKRAVYEALRRAE